VNALQFEQGLGVWVFPWLRGLEIQEGRGFPKFRVQSRTFRNPNVFGIDKFGGRDGDGEGIPNDFQRSRH